MTWGRKVWLQLPFRPHYTVSAPELGAQAQTSLPRLNFLGGAAHASGFLANRQGKAVGGQPEQDHSGDLADSGHVHEAQQRLSAEHRHAGHRQQCQH
jgi:hypothetical protein